MKTRMLLTPLQELAWASAKRESLAAEDRVAELAEQATVLTADMESTARNGARRYNAALAAIFKEHGYATVPADTELVTGEDDGCWFAFTEEEKVNGS